MEGLHPLKIAARPEAWRLFSLRKADAAFDAFSRKVLGRDSYICQFCGFQATKFQEVINLDGNYRNNKQHNLMTACCFCMQCCFIESVGKNDYGGGSLVYLPEVSQNDLNGLCHVLFCAISNATSYRSDAQDIYRSLRLRAKVVEKQLGEGMSDPALFGRILVDMPDRDRTRIEEEILPSYRLLPSYSKFTKQVEFWSNDSLDELYAE